MGRPTPIRLVKGVLIFGPLERRSERENFCFKSACEKVEGQGLCLEAVKGVPKHSSIEQGEGRKDGWRHDTKKLASRLSQGVL